MKTEDEVVDAHDLLVSLILGELPLPTVDEEARLKLTVACDALCWVLGHSHNRAFEGNLERLRRQMKEAGYVRIG